SLAFALGLAEMFLAVFELRDADGDGLGALAGEFFDFLKLFPELPGVLDFGDDFFGDVLVTVEEMEQLLANSIDEFGADVGVAELVLGLGLEDGVLEANGNRADHAFADVVAFEFLVGVLVDGFQKALAERAEVGAAITGVLAVDERIEGFAEPAVAVGETELERFFGVMQGRINRFAVVRLQVLHDEIQKAVT